MSRLGYELIAFVMAMFFIFCCMMFGELIGVDWRNILLYALTVKLMREDAWRLFK